MTVRKPEIPIEVLQDLLEYGPIIAASSDLGIIVTANGAYQNLWDSHGNNFDCRSRDKDFYNTTAAELWDEGKAFFEELDDSDEEE